MSDPTATERVLANRYRLVQLIARGGMAEVWEAHDEVLARPVAVKLLHRHLSEDADVQERFRREAISAAKLSHPNVVSTYDAGSDEGVGFIVMELVRGETLRHHLTEGPLPVGRTLRIGAAVAAALEHAHRSGLVHRDVKPANILICQDGGAERVMVADFGIAKAAASQGSDLTQTGAIIGTAKYLSPEQVEGREPDSRSDVYSLGIVLYEMLCGQPPFVADTELATALLHLREDPEPPRRVRAGVPPGVEAVVMKALARDPAHRYQSADDLRQALDGVDLSDDAQPFEVPDPTPPSGTTPRPRKPRPPLVPIALVLVVGVLGLAVVAWLLAGQDNRPRDPGGSSGEPQPAQIASIRTFDPQGNDGRENDDQAPSAIDGNPATDWRTDRYSSRAFGRLKDGVGLVFALTESRELTHLSVTSGTRGWAARVYVADAVPDDLAGWGQPAAEKSGLNEQSTFDLGGRRGRFVLLWITDLGVGNRTSIAEVVLSR